MAEDELDILRGGKVPPASDDARRRALAAALAAYDENFSAAAQGTAGRRRRSTGARSFWSRIMDRRFLSTPAIASILALPVAVVAALYLVDGGPVALEPGRQDTAGGAGDKGKSEPGRKQATVTADPAAETPRNFALEAAPPPFGLSGATAPARTREFAGHGVAQKAYGPAPAALPMPSPDIVLVEPENRDRLEAFDTNPVRSALETPVSTFSIDVDTASYAFVRAALKGGALPQRDTVRVEEMVNYFPYGWQGPAEAATPFNTTVTVMPTPWNEHTRLMHVAIKGYDVQPAQRPRANLVFLVDTSGSMSGPDRLPLLKGAFRLLVEQLDAEDTVSIVAYAGSAGTVLEPTRGAERAKILAALDRLESGGSTAGEAGIREAYRLAEQSFVEGGVNRVMLATDGDFNVGQTSDDELERLVEEKRGSGVFLSVFGFGRGNYNDRMMQTLAQNGNGVAAYIDTLAEAEKTLVQEATSNLFPIAKDVKIQVEFNPQAISEYRLIGYETRALKREDFSNDRVDAGDIGSGHSVTAIYEMTPKGSPAEVIGDLRYGQARSENPGGIADPDEYAFVKIRYKLPQEDVSRLIERPVTPADAIASFDAAGEDQRFSVAVAAFGQKLRGTDQTAGFGYDRIIEIATAARGADPFGYRAEFLQLVRLASALDGSGR